jgi:hypothetical protein
VFGVARSPKLVNRNGARSRGAVVNVAANGRALLSLSAVTVYPYALDGLSPVSSAW